MIHKIVWPVCPVNAEVYAAIASIFRESRDYSKLLPHDRDRITQLANDINAEERAHARAHAPTHSGNNQSDSSAVYDRIIVPVEQIMAIRNVILKDKIIKNYKRMNQIIPKIVKKYESGEDIIKLSRSFDFPPMNLLRGIFLFRGMDPQRVYSVFANKTDPSKLLSTRDLKQYWEAEQNDAESTFNQQIAARIAEENEALFVSFLTRAGISLTTQAKLVAEQMKEHGRAIATPDVLFNDEVFINGNLIKWIDYKDYIGTNVNFLYRSNLEQVNRYEKIWGPGALCYHRSFVEGLTISSAMLLDTSAMNLKFK